MECWNGIAYRGVGVREYRRFGEVVLLWLDEM